MIRKTEQYYIKKLEKLGFATYRKQERKKTVYWFLGFIPVYIKNEVLGGDYEIR